MMPVTTFRYLAIGGSNFVLDILIYFISYNFILQKQEVMVSPGIVISSHIFALIISFCICIPYGFLMSKFVVFQSSNLKGRIQLFRYLVIVGVNSALTYALLKLLVEVLHIFPTVSRIIIAIIVAALSFFVNQRFSFGTSDNEQKTRPSA